MITIRLLGGAKKALDGRASVQFEKTSATVSEVLKYLQSLSSHQNLLNPANLIIALNGTDSTALQGQATMVKSGDVVTVVTVVHGGSHALTELDRVAIFGVRKIQSEDIGGILDRIRKANDDLFIQAVKAESVFGTEHAVRILAIVMEAKKRGVMMANKVETELLLRLACTNQISEAISRVGLEKGSSACFVGFSDKSAKMKKFREYMNTHFEVDESVLQPSPQKKTKLVRRLGLNPKTAPDDLLNHLVENAARMTK
jgi:tRNA threonylcarbamoyladenosine modification (KEOPS) complex Cgi121 subunit/molybdopterin converting factor small subunit